MTFSSNWTLYYTSTTVPTCRVGNDLLSVIRNGGMGQTTTGGNGQTSTGRIAYSTLVASGSLFFYTVPTVSTTTKGANILRIGDQGATTGTLRTVLRINETDSGLAQQTGILCMQQYSNIVSGIVCNIGTGYGLAWKTGISALFLFQFSNGLSNQVALSTTALSTAVGSSIAMQLHWEVSGATILLQAAGAPGTSYGTLSALFSATIAASAFVSTAGQGFYAMQIGGATSAFDVSMDVSERTV